MTDNSIIKLEAVDVYQQKHLVLSNVNLQIDKGEFVFLIGQTGSGKSSLLKIIYGDLIIANGAGSVAGFELRKIALVSISFIAIGLLAIILINNKLSAWILSVPAATALPISFSVLTSLFSNQVASDKQGWIMWG